VVHPPPLRRLRDCPPVRAGWLYVALAALATLASGRLFYGYMLHQTGGEWSAPLDDVFIHFDYARATARGAPFQWTEGNGYSSGNTSLSYPFVLAFGYWLGFRSSSLMMWAAVVASMATLGFLWSLPRLFGALPRATHFLAIAGIFSVGALSWSLWSGMEVAFFLGVWGLLLALAHGTATGQYPRRAGLFFASATGLLLVWTRPEAITSLGLIALWSARLLARRRRRSLDLPAVLVLVLPAVAGLVLQAGVNKLLTGESTANGALVKLAVYNPYMDTQEKLAEWLFHLRYCLDRIRLHHFGEFWPWGHLPFVFALWSLVDKRTRTSGALLLSSVVSWVLVVALNGQVRWQNERYLMPAVAWLLLAAALGVAALLTTSAEAARKHRAGFRRGVALVVVLVSAVLFWRGERIQYRDQVWFFGRASRNIRDQHLTVGHALRALDPPPTRVLVGDAGAILYASDLPGFDLIGLGGYHELPLARAGVQGVAASLELIEHLPRRERPDVFALYPSWWGSMPDMFGRRMFGVEVHGNVICGGAEKVVYLADWHLLGTGEKPRSVSSRTPIFDAVDMADLLSERAHEYTFPHPHGGYAVMRILPANDDPVHDLWDGERILSPGRSETFTLSHLPAKTPVRLLLRTTADTAFRTEISVPGFTGFVESEKRDGWVEVSVDLPATVVTSRLPVRITPVRGEWTSYHLWAIPPP
jgi:hypothetical protein